MNWLDQHTAPVWAYTTLYRPASPGFTIPKDGYLLRLDSDPAAKFDTYKFGVVYYDRPLSNDQIRNYEMLLLPVLCKPGEVGV